MGHMPTTSVGQVHEGAFCSCLDTRTSVHQRSRLAEFEADEKMIFDTHLYSLVC